jgi:hypothetical protein
VATVNYIKSVNNGVRSLQNTLASTVRNLSIAIVTSNVPLNMTVRTASTVQSNRDFFCTAATSSWSQQAVDTAQLLVDKVFEVTVPASNIMIGLKLTAVTASTVLQNDAVAMMFSAALGATYGTGFNNGNISGSSVLAAANDVMMLKRETTRVVASVRRANGTVVFVANIPVTSVTMYPAIAFNNVNLLAQNPTTGN